MRKNLSLLILAVFALSLLTACQTTSTALMAGNNTNKSVPTNAAPKTDEHATADDAPRVSLADAKKDFDAGTAIFVDTRAAAAYQNEHIKGSINVSSENFEAEYKKLPTGKKIIAYCS